MTPNVGIIERAFQLARSGEYASVAEIRQKLDQEGYPNIQAHLASRTLITALRKLCSASAPVDLVPREPVGED